ncbi:cation:proton antiporter [Sphingosinicella microcystinivorans]|uniref:cation:proton antiporter domain-containing protein n=1 Tax=Sphingosinicella microcystinivorans TaxID=335406 RepID=UPI001C6CBBD5|nr:cation:proton antiporter [Sphingosinicella microcystinivorans]MBW7945636.1 cation:proton antiporter [Sphingomonadaceae bacterium]WBX83463.1 cation:proton antiporter [Sphingosinicella microcystinivorans]
MHHDNLILILVGGFVLAFLFGMLANRLRLSPIVGYLLAGVAVGPFTPGWVADLSLAPQLAEIGVILLMFGVGLHFSPKELVRVQSIALPGAIAQIAVATALGWGVGMLMGMSGPEAAIFGFSLSVASTVVLLRAIESRGQLKTSIGQIAVGWLLVEDMVIIVALVLLPLLVNMGAHDSGAAIAREIMWTFAKIAAFLALMFVVGVRAMPTILVWIAHTRSRELFTLGVLSIALGIAWLAYAVFGASFALGAFVAGLVLNSTPLGHNAAERSLPLRDAFAVLFFVSVGMLFDPATLVREPIGVFATLAIILVGKSLAAIAVTNLFGRNRREGLTIAASLAQIGEFSFILAGLGVTLELISHETNNLILAAALLSIALNPFMFKLADRLTRDMESPPEPAT